MDVVVVQVIDPNDDMKVVVMSINVVCVVFSSVFKVYVVNVFLTKLVLF